MNKTTEQRVVDVGALPDCALIKVCELYNTSRRRGLFPISMHTYMRKVKANLLPRPDIDHGNGERYYRAATVKKLLGVSDNE